MDWQWKTKREVHRRAEKVNSLLGWRGCTPEVDGERYTGSVIMAPRAIDELTERAKHPQPPPLTAENIRTLLRDADERFMRDLELRGSSRADDRASTGVDDDATDSEG